MGSQLFTSKKMNLTKESRLKKSVIGIAVMAVLSAAVFGIYSWSGSGSQEPRQKKSYAASEPKRPSFLPSFASSSNTVKSSFSGKKQAEHQSKKAKGHRLVSHKKHKGQKYASHKKHKGQKYASHKKHKGHKYASHKKHKGHKYASHKKHGKKMAYKHKASHNKQFAAN